MSMWWWWGHEGRHRAHAGGREGQGGAGDGLTRMMDHMLITPPLHTTQHNTMTRHDGQEREQGGGAGGATGVRHDRGRGVCVCMGRFRGATKGGKALAGCLPGSDSLSHTSPSPPFPPQNNAAGAPAGAGVHAALDLLAGRAGPPRHDQDPRLPVRWLIDRLSGLLGG
jgi:hypothetical protein